MALFFVFLICAVLWCKININSSMGEYYLVLNSLNNFKETYPTKSQQEENKTYKIFLKRGKNTTFLTVASIRENTKNFKP